MHYDLKKSKAQPDSGHKGYEYSSSKAQPDSSGSKEKSSSSGTNLIKIIENHNICCVYKINTKNYYRNIPYCHYRKKPII